MNARVLSSGAAIDISGRLLRQFEEGDRAVRLTADTRTLAARLRHGR